MRRWNVTNQEYVMFRGENSTFHELNQSIKPLGYQPIIRKPTILISQFDWWKNQYFHTMDSDTICQLHIERKTRAWRGEKSERVERWGNMIKWKWMVEKSHLSTEMTVFVSLFLAASPQRTIIRIYEYNEVNASNSEIIKVFPSHNQVGHLINQCTSKTCWCKLKTAFRNRVAQKSIFALEILEMLWTMLGSHGKYTMLYQTRHSLICIYSMCLFWGECKFFESHSSLSLSLFGNH